ncbi:hypothetical protein [uncultured Shimia sp.]|mgnify:CR=1 FL=1|uniref:hypothetical protein n=1 Tax=uncultured Shimia sp. TaxID=573152 RepID=UPI0025F12E1A|nr:hypothetical protein [uncultured Shimia sp.]
MNPLTIAELALSFSADTCFGLMSSKWGKRRQARRKLHRLWIGDIGDWHFVASVKKQPTPALTQAYLKSATDTLRSHISEDAFSEEVIDKLAPLQTLAKQVDSAMKRALANTKSRNRFDPELDDNLNKDWASHYTAFKKTDGYRKLCLDTSQ